jgi:hypothetical protein
MNTGLKIARQKYLRKAVKESDCTTDILENIVIEAEVDGKKGCQNILSNLRSL